MMEMMARSKKKRNLHIVMSNYVLICNQKKKQEYTYVSREREKVKLPKAVRLCISSSGHQQTPRHQVLRESFLACTLKTFAENSIQLLKTTRRHDASGGDSSREEKNANRSKSARWYHQRAKK
jgi:hypothetical protein